MIIKHNNRFAFIKSREGDDYLPEHLFPILSDLSLDELESRIEGIEKEFLHIHGLAAFAQSQLRADTLSNETSEQIFGAIAESAFWSIRYLEDRFLAEGRYLCESCDGSVISSSEAGGGRNE